MATVREDVVKIGFDIDMGELSRLVSALDDIKSMLTGGVGDDTFDEMVKDSKKAADGLDDVKDSIKGIKPDGIDETAKGLRDTESEAKDAHDQLKKIANTGFDKTVSGLKTIVKTLGRVALEAGKVLLKGLALGAAGVATIVTKSVMSFADYEQLVGGVETLFKDSGGTVQKYAQNAYKTAGLSANEYMSTVTSFSASLIQSLGGDTKKSADYANMAITDMADNANKMGTDMGAIQDAYQGFAKQNYTMLDNLKLGYGGTQKEMERLLKDAEKITGIKYDITSFADIVSAIHVIQTEYGITGTTAKEAGDTILGSFASMKAAWGNALTALILGGDDFDRCVDNLVDSAKTFGKNVMPAITKALEGVGSLITELAPIVEAELPGIIDTLLPPLIKAATSLVKALIIALPDIISTLVAELPAVLTEVWSAIKEAFGDVPGFEKAELFFNKLVEFIEKNTGTIKKLVPAVLGLVAAFKLFKAINGLSGLLGGGEKGGSGDGFFGSLSKMKPTTVLKGMANLGIIIGGLIILASLLMWLAPHMAKLSDLKSIAEVLLVITAIGLIGTELAKMAGSVGSIPVATVAKGLANIAIVFSGIGVLAAVLMTVSPYLAQLSDLKSIGKYLLVIAAVGLVGSALAELAGLVGNIPVATVAKGVANIAIVMVGMGALAAALMWVSPYLSELSDLESVGKVLIVIGAAGLIGGALSGIAGLVGMIPIPVVLTGLANIALALGGFTAIIAAFGALSKIDGFNDFIASGGETLTQICGIIGDMAGSLVGNFAEGISDSLPAIGENLSAFATSLQPMFDTFAGVDGAAFGEFAASLGIFLAAIAGEKIVSLITGGIDYGELGNKLSTMATGLSGFFTTIMTIPEGGFEKATALFDCLAGISSMPKEGGIVGWFEGEVDYAKMATGLTQLAGAAGAFTTIQTIPAEAFATATKLFDCLAGVKSLPKEGGLVGWFQGEVDFGSIATGIQSLASEGLISALTTISALPENAFTSLTAMFDALANIKAMPKEGGIAGWFTGDASTGLSNVATQLPGIATSIASFFTNLGGITDFTPIKSLFDTLSSVKLDTDVAEGTGLFGGGASQLESMGTALSNFATNASTFFTSINGLNLETMSGFFDELSTIGDLPESISSIDETIGTALGTVVTTAQTKMTEIKTTVTTGLSGVVTAVNAKSVHLYAAGMNLMLGLKNGMLAMLPSLLMTASMIATRISSTINSALDIHSPSRVTFESGVNTGEGLNLGLLSKIPEIKATANQVGLASIPYTGNYSPESDSDTIYNNGGNSEYTTVSPVFNLTISGSQDDRALARRVKAYVAEAIQETFESLERKSAVLREV